MRAITQRSKAAVSGTGQRERVLGFLMLAGAGLAVLTAAMPPAATESEGVVYLCAAIALCIGLGLLTASAQDVAVNERLLGAGAAFGTVLITVASWASGFADTANADNELLYLWVCIYSFYFFSRRHALVQLGVIGCAYGVLLYGFDPGGGATTRLLVTVSTLLVAGLVLSGLREAVERALSELRDRARRDELTGLLNRRGLDEVAIREFARSRRIGAPVGFLLVDVDQFRVYNDLQGHRAGDELLVHIGTSLDDSVRAVDSVAYLGADQFGVILPGAGAGELEEVGSRLRGDLDATWEGPVLATISIGAASGPAEGHALDDLWQAAERALAIAKAGGGDQLRLTRDPLPTNGA